MTAPGNPNDRYGSDVLSGDWRSAGRVKPAQVPAERGLVLELADSGFVGALVRMQGRTVELEDRHGKVRVFPVGSAFLVDGAPVVLVPAAKQPQSATALRTASGSVAASTPQPARVARASRIFVEGRHDAELVEKVWGADLRGEGVVVEYLEGVDHLAEVLREFRPGAGRRVGVLVDHLVAGSKESRITQGLQGENVLIVGHPFIDVWQSVKPARLGIDAWPTIPRSVEWKHGICAAFGWPHDDQADIAAAWQRILSRVRSYQDLEPALLGRVEELIDFVTRD
ncbi:DUF3097 domain-containing protein [Schumannella soli]|uniref:DUF3097 domain-containing protein n=1 Tax=Schumannella soli TaxID=2590779 RepID=A0A506XXU9_9MICO|nr:DUF3097 domain-containing protein [Schumannella soli]TPW74615.1 DUF3097 domain-containing protein [Schumannella soli]